MIRAIALAVVLAPTADLRLRLPANRVRFVLVERREEDGKKTDLTTQLSLGGPPTDASLTIGPFASGGRTFGRAKVRRARLDSRFTLVGDSIGRPPFCMAIPLPGKAVPVGGTWRGTIVGPTPTPAGVPVTYRLVRVVTVGGIPHADIAIKIDSRGGTEVIGKGRALVKLADGLPSKASLDLGITYRRADPKTGKVGISPRLKTSASLVRR